MDYSALSDFEINSAVHNALMKEPYKLEFLGGDRIRWTKKASDVVTNKTEYSKKTLSDYCNSPAGAWSIIADSKISLLWVEETSMWCASAGGNAESEYWGWDECPDHHYEHPNPLRAAMVVFLMMQDK